MSARPTKGISPAQAAAAAKRAGAKRTIEITLTPEQLASLGKQWSKIKPTEAAVLVFKSGATAVSHIKVAGYSYHGDTCCA